MKDPAILLYTSDFLTATIFMSMEERGQLITMACLQQQHGHMEMSEIETIVGQLSKRVRDTLKTDEDGKYYIERVELEIERRKKYSKSQSDKVRKRWRGDGITAVDTGVIPIETETEKEKETETETETEKETEGGPGEDAASTFTPAASDDIPCPNAPQDAPLSADGEDRPCPETIALPPAREDGQLPPPRPGRRPEDFSQEEIRRIHRRIDKVRPGLSDIAKRVLTQTEISRQCGLHNPGFPDVEHYFQATQYALYLKDRAHPVWPPSRAHYRPDTPQYVLESLGIG